MDKRNKIVKVNPFHYMPHELSSRATLVLKCHNQLFGFVSVTVRKLSSLFTAGPFNEVYCRESVLCLRVSSDLPSAVPDSFIVVAEELKL